jgi:hypothetical protein
MKLRLNKEEFGGSSVGIIKGQSSKRIRDDESWSYSNGFYQKEDLSRGH